MTLMYNAAYSKKGQLYWDSKGLIKLSVWKFSAWGEVWWLIFHFS